MSSALPTHPRLQGRSRVLAKGKPWACQAEPSQHPEHQRGWEPLLWAQLTGCRVVTCPGLGFGMLQTHMPRGCAAWPSALFILFPRAIFPVWVSSGVTAGDQLHCYTSLLGERCGEKAVIPFNITPVLSNLPNVRWLLHNFIFINRRQRHIS